MQDLAVIDTKGKSIRLALIAAVLIALVCGWMAVRWQLGNMLASLTAATDPNLQQIANLAVRWSPLDPNANWLKATTTNTVEDYERAVRLAPNDYRWRLELGRALEQDEQFERAEAEFKNAVALAPSFAYPRWRLGNFYLRQDRPNEALAELRNAAENNQIYRDQAFSLVWDFFGKDPAIVESLVSGGGDTRARLAYFFAGRGRAEDALRNWNMLSDDEKAAHPEVAKGMAHGLYIQRYFPQALEFSRQAGLDPDAQVETVTNGSFERGIGETPDSRFSWQVIRNDPKFDATIDQKVKQDGNRSLRVSFRNYIKPELYNVTQTVAVVPSQRYRLRFWVRTENLKSAGPPLLEIVNANDDMPMARSATYPTGSVDWQQITLDFKTPETCSGITVRTTRAYCGENCPIVGMFWYDSFELARL